MLIQMGISLPVTTVPQTTATAPATETSGGIAENTVAAEIESAPADESNIPGVLRHLQAGKFKGVADVRLRIVFQKQLAELAEQQAQARAQEGSAALVSSITSEINAFVATPEPAEAQNRSYENRRRGCRSDRARERRNRHCRNFRMRSASRTNSLGGGDGQNLQDYAATLQAAFDSLVSNLEIALAPEVETVAANLQVTIQDGDTEALDVSVTATLSAESEADAMSAMDFLASLREMFAQELTALLESAESRDILPPLSEPQGNGRAYDKFKAIYDAMNAADPVAEDDTNINVEAWTSLANLRVSPHPKTTETAHHFLDIIPADEQALR